MVQLKWDKALGGYVPANLPVRYDPLARQWVEIPVEVPVIRPQEGQSIWETPEYRAIADLYQYYSMLPPLETEYELPRVLGPPITEPPPGITIGPETTIFDVVAQTRGLPPPNIPHVDEEQLQGIDTIFANKQFNLEPEQLEKAKRRARHLVMRGWEAQPAVSQAVHEIKGTVSKPTTPSWISQTPAQKESFAAPPPSLSITPETSIFDVVAQTRGLSSPIAAEVRWDKTKRWWTPISAL